MKSTLIDAGPIIALFNKNDKYHQVVKSFLETYKGRLITSWPVITEASHMLDFNVQVQIDLFRWIRLGGLIIEEVTLEDIDRIIALSEKYSDIPMDLADATMVVLSEKLKIKEIVTIDSDYYIYRTIEKEMIKNILEYT
ncbi:MAG: PIN domain-containing protein [Alkalibacterium sp.]|uniref:type II toxin-antitoxin system VapC family toxin n=1 Tax=Alkalibacterium sp. TaxID=1872447 RepID=UPI00397058AA